MAIISASEFLRKANETGIQTPAPTPTPVAEAPDTAGNRVRQTIRDAGGAVDDAIQGDGEFENMSAVRRGTAATAELLKTPLKVAMDVAPKPIRDVAEAIDMGIGKGIAWLADKVSDNKKLQSWVMQNPDAARNLDEVLGTVAELGEVAGSIAAVEGGVRVANKAPAVATAAFKSIPMPSTALYRKPAAFLSEKSYDLAIGRNAAEAERIIDYRAAKELGIDTTKPITRADTAREYGLAGRQTDIGVQAKIEGTKLYQNKIKPALQESTEVITKEDLFKPLEAKIERTVDPSRKADLKDAYDALVEEYANETQWNLEQAQALKSGIDKFTPEKVFRGKPIASTYNELRNDMANTIRMETYNRLKDMGIKKDYLDLSNLIELEKVGVKGLTDSQLKGGAGTFISGILDKVITPVLTVGGKVLYKVAGSPVTFTGREGLTSFRQFLGEEGFNVKSKTQTPEGGDTQ